MEHPDSLVAVSAITLENGQTLFARVLGLPYFLVPLSEAKEGFLLEKGKN